MIGCGVNPAGYILTPTPWPGYTFSYFRLPVLLFLLSAGRQVFQALTRRTMTAEVPTSAQELPRSTEVNDGLDHEDADALTCGTVQVPVWFAYLQGAVVQRRGVFGSMMRGLFWPFGIVVRTSSSCPNPVGTLFAAACRPNMAPICRCAHTAAFGGCWASGSHRKRPWSAPPWPALGARTSPAASVCAG